MATAINIEIQAGDKHHRKAGELLIKQKALLPHGAWLPWLQANVKCSISQAQRYMEMVNNTASCGIINPSTIDEVQAAVDTAHQPRVVHNTGDEEWYTPIEYLDAARVVLQAIDLDPASSHQAQEHVRASTYYTREDDGLAHAWSGRVWLNPPYSKGLIDKFVHKLCEHYSAREVTQAIVLVNNATDTKWFHQLALFASAFCFPRGRLKQWLSPEIDKGSSPTQGQVFCYLGENNMDFVKEFSKYGLILVRTIE